MSEEARLQVAAFAALSLAAFGFVVILSFWQAEAFQPYFGRIPPLVAITLVIVAGALSMRRLYVGGWFRVVNPRMARKGIALSAAVVLVFALEVTVLDILVRFPENINVPSPQALLFYPVIGYVVEVVFHLMPLALFLTLLERRGKGSTTTRMVWFCIILTALLEPTYQLAFVERPYTWTAVYLWARLFAFNLIQLSIFRRFDFVSMYSFRLLYYAYWHIAWGYARLRLLF